MSKSKKLNKRAEYFDELQAILRKEAEAADSVVGTPNADTNAEKVPDSTEKVNQDAVVPEDNEQKVEQEDCATDAKEPVQATKSAADQLGDQILDLVSKKLKKAEEEKKEEETKTEEGEPKKEEEKEEEAKKEAEAADSVVGTPNADTNAESVPDSTETVDQNAVKPETNPQEVDQVPNSTQAAEPVVAQKAASADVAKIAEAVEQYQLGMKIGQALIQQQTVAAKAQQKQASVYKEAGAREFENFISTLQQKLAEQEMVAQTKQAAYVEEEPTEEQIKTAEELGAQTFDNLYKEAQFVELQTSVAELKQKLAEKEELEKQAIAAYENELLQKQAQETMYQLRRDITTDVVNALKSEVASS